MLLVHDPLLEPGKLWMCRCLFEHLGLKARKMRGKGEAQTDWTKGPWVDLLKRKLWFFGCSLGFPMETNSVFLNDPIFPNQVGSCFFLNSRSLQTNASFQGRIDLRKRDGAKEVCRERGPSMQMFGVVDCGMQCLFLSLPTLDRSIAFMTIIE